MNDTHVRSIRTLLGKYEATLATRTRKKRTQLCTYLDDFFYRFNVDIAVDNITSGDVDKYVAELRLAGHTRTNIARRKQALSGFYGWLRAGNWVQYNPVRAGRKRVERSWREMFEVGSFTSSA